MYVLMAQGLLYAGSDLYVKDGIEVHAYIFTSDSHVGQI